MDMNNEVLNNEVDLFSNEDYVVPEVSEVLANNTSSGFGKGVLATLATAAGCTAAFIFVKRRRAKKMAKLEAKEIVVDSELNDCDTGSETEE